MYINTNESWRRLTLFPFRSLLVITFLKLIRPSPNNRKSPDKEIVDRSFVKLRSTWFAEENRFATRIYDGFSFGAEPKNITYARYLGEKSFLFNLSSLRTYERDWSGKRVISDRFNASRSYIFTSFLSQEILSVYKPFIFGFFWTHAVCTYYMYVCICVCIYACT